MTTAHLRPCPACSRHARVSEAACPFCGQALGPAFRAAPRPRTPSARLSRAAMVAVGAGALGLTPGCSSLYGGTPLVTETMGDGASTPGITDSGPVYIESDGHPYLPPDYDGAPLPCLESYMGLYGAPPYAVPCLPEAATGDALDASVDAPPVDAASVDASPDATATEPTDAADDRPTVYPPYGTPPI